MKSSHEMLTEFINAVNKTEADNLRRHCQELHGEQWNREWEERAAKAATTVVPA